MPFNVLLLPLLGGYIFISCWNRTKFTVKRYSGERLIFHAAIVGVFLLIISYVLISLVVWQWPGIYRWRQTIAPFPYLGTSLLAFLLGLGAWWPLNLVFSEEQEIQRTIEAWNDYLEILLKRAIQETSQISLTLKNGKVYVGFAVQTFNPAYDRKYIVVLPTISGYRDSEHKLNFTTDYTSVYQQLTAQEDTRALSDTRNFHVIVPVSEIQSANLFNWKTYRFFGSPTETPPPSDQVDAC